MRSYADPFTGRPVELPTTNVVSWVLGHANASFDPRTPNDPNWRPLKPR